MSIILNLLMMAIIGAAIGGVTNSLAIKMLFRPYKPVYIGKWKVPFTPGLIPKRRDELSRQLGLLVVNYLVTPDTIKNKIMDSNLQRELMKWLEPKIKELLQTEQTILAWLEKLGIDHAGQKIDSYLHTFMEKSLNRWIEANRFKKLEDIIPAGFWNMAEDKIPVISEYLLTAIINYLEGTEGKQLLQKHLDQFLGGRGMFGGMLQMVLGQSNISDKIHTELVKILQNEENKRIINQLLKNEMQKFKDKSLDVLINKVNEDGSIDKFIDQVKMVVSADQVLQKPISSFIGEEEANKLIKSVVPSVLDTAVLQLVKHVDTIMERLQIVEMVKNQVDSFPTKRLEELVLGITGKELKMITYLGAYLGGIIGLLQGAIVLWLN